MKGDLMYYRGGWMGALARSLARNKGNKGSGGRDSGGLGCLVAIIVIILVILMTRNIFILGVVIYIILLIWALFS